MSDACPEHRGDGRVRDAGRHRRDAIAVPEPPGARLRTLHAGRSHNRAHLPVRGLAGDGPQGASRAPRTRLEVPHAVHELKGVDQILGNRNGAPVVPPALEGRNPELVRLEVDVRGADPERLGNPAPGHRECVGEGLDGRLRVRAHRGEEALALGGGEILPAARVDEGEGSVRHGRKSYITSEVMTTAARALPSPRALSARSRRGLGLGVSGNVPECLYGNIPAGGLGPRRAGESG